MNSLPIKKPDLDEKVSAIIKKDNWNFEKVNLILSKKGWCFDTDMSVLSNDIEVVYWTVLDSNRYKGTLPVRAPDFDRRVKALVTSGNGEFHITDLLSVDEDDVSWRFDDDGSELSNMADVVYWEYL
jgi:hypothetical protein